MLRGMGMGCKMPVAGLAFVKAVWAMFCFLRSSERAPGLMRLFFSIQ